MGQGKKRHIFNARGRRTPKSPDGLFPLPAALNDNGRLTPRQRGFVRNADRITDKVSARTILMDAVIAGNVDLASRLIRSGADIDKVDKLGQTALHYAIQRGASPLMTMLLEYGANPNMLTKAQDTPLLLSLATPETAGLAAILLDAGADVSLANKLGLLPLHRVAQLGFVDGSLDLLMRILEATPDPNRCDAKGATALHYAVRGCQQAALEKLLYYRLDVLAATHDGQTCLHEAAKLTDMSCATTLLQGWSAALLNAVNHEGRTPLHLAVEVGHEAIIQTMLKQGALTARYDDKGMTPLHIAAKTGKAGVVHLLLENGATLNGVAGKDGASPLLTAIRAGHGAIARTMLERGADVNLADASGVTPLMLTANRSMYDLTELIFEQGGNPALKDKDGRHVLHWCAEGLPASLLARLILAGAEIEARDHEERTPLLAVLHAEEQNVALELIKAGADVKVQDEDGHAPLHMSISLRYSAVTTALIARGVDISVRERHHGMTPLHVAAQTGQVSEVRRLLHYGANKDVRDNNGRTPLHHAITPNLGAPPVIQHLLTIGADALARDRRNATPYDIAFSHQFSQLAEIFKAHLKQNGYTYSPRHVPMYPFGYPPSWP